jgi:hypothetical protein
VKTSHVPDKDDDGVMAGGMVGNGGDGDVLVEGTLAGQVVEKDVPLRMLHTPSNPVLQIPPKSGVSHQAHPVDATHALHDD